ncbi:MAG: hypothetical protein RIQ33_93 [Bacteroidota bacterium]|jgi:hypothetical protein
MLLNIHQKKMAVAFAKALNNFDANAMDALLYKKFRATTLFSKQFLTVIESKKKYLTHLNVAFKRMHEKDLLFHAKVKTISHDNCLIPCVVIKPLFSNTFLYPTSVRQILKGKTPRINTEIIIFFYQQDELISKIEMFDIVDLADNKRVLNFSHINYELHFTNNKKNATN